MKKIAALAAAVIAVLCNASADPQLSSWLTPYSAQYARAYTNTSERSSGTSVTKWSGQSLPSYADIPYVASSASWVYVRAADLPSYVIGPWLNPQGRPGTLYPANQHELERFPRSPSAQAGTKTISGTGYSGLYVNGVAVFNFTDGKAWDPTNLDIVSGPHNKGTYYWHRNAPIGEGFNFDYALGHQNPAGVYHTHQQPIALRYELGDHVDFDSSSKNYSESTNSPTQHSPIIGWAYDGFPIYGPYGYSVSNDASSGIRRMVSGYVLRTGASGTDNLTNDLNVIPAWYARFRQAHFGETYSTTTTQTRPSVSGTNYLGTFAEDYDYYGDITNPATGQLYAMGTNTFDLDEYNGRWCVTPEFPGGTYAYFIDIDSNGTPVYPYAIAYEYYGVASGGAVSGITESVTTNFYGGADTALTLNTPTLNATNDLVTLSWSSTEGGTYEVESSTDQNTWTVEQTNIAAFAGISTATNYTTTITNGTAYVRVTRTGLASYDDDGAGSGVVNQAAIQSYEVGLTLTLSASNTFTEHGPFALVASNSVVADGSTSNFSGGSLSVSGVGGYDELFIAPEGTGAGQIGVSGNTVSYGGETFGDFSGGSGGVTLTINFTNASASAAAVQELVDRIAFTNSYCNPSGSTRSIVFALSDGSGNSASATNQLGFITVDDPPTISYVNPLGGAVENTPFNISNVTITANSDMSDCENGYFGYRVVSVTSGTLTLNGNAVTPGSTTIWPTDYLVWTPPVDGFGTNINAFVIEGFDGLLTSINSVQVSVAVAHANQLPTVTLNPTNQSVCAGDSISLVATGSGDPAPTEQWQVKANGSSAFSDISGETNSSYTFTAGISDNGSQFQAVFTSSSGSATSAVATLTVNALPTAPTVSFSPSSPCANSAGNTASGPAGVSGYAWTVVSNATITSGANLQTVTYTAGSGQEVMLQLTVTNASGCTAQSTGSAVINPLPDATITAVASVYMNSTTNTASAPNNPAGTYSWSIANGAISSGANAQTITYTAGASGNVELMLIAANSSGCTASNHLEVPIISNATNPPASSDPQLTSWLTADAGHYARIYTNDLSRTNGVSVVTWTNPVSPNLAQSLPTYAGVQEVDYSTNWIYVHTPDLAPYIMGPWYNDATRTGTFVNWPTNQHVVYVLPRTSTLTTPPAVKTPTYGAVDAIGCFVNGVMMFDALDGFVWNGSTEAMGGSGQWRRAAYPNEGPTLDPGNSHQQNTGEYHNHADPIALRYALGDHVDFNPATKIYTESTNAPAKHSPILGWVRDGNPMYGPYGYSNPTNPASGIRRMGSGYQLRNGENGSDNITNVGRATLPAWMLRNNGNTTQSGPPVDSSYPAGRYLQDYAYLGDLTNSVTGTNYQLGTDFDLNEFGCRWCVTPEFPNGTWAYFVTIDSNGVPIAPWNVGMYFYGNPTGYKGSNVTQTVVTNFVGVPDVAPVLNSPAVKNGTVTLSWSATEGGTYQVESSTNLMDWTTNSTSVQAILTSASYTNNASNSRQFYRVEQSALAPFDPVTVTNSGGTGGTAVVTMSPNAGNRGQTYTLTATISASASPPPPPQSGAPVQTFTVGSISVTGASYTYSNGTATVTGTLTIPAGASTGLQTVVITFSPPPGQTSGPSYTQASAFTVN